jgi:polysaccharide export outer membrane protein
MDNRLRLALAVLAVSALTACASSTPTGTIAAAPAPIDAGDLSPAGARTIPESGDTRGTLVPAVVGVPQTPAGTPVYVISPGDVLRVDVFQVEELSTEERVDDAGSIVMPLVGPLTVAGLTPAQAEAKIAAALQQDYLQNPQVNVFVAEYANMKVTVGGAVNKPGVFQLTGTTTLMEAIAQAEGVTNLANTSEVIVFRKPQDQPVSAYVIDLAKVEKGQLTDPVLLGSDKVIVPESGSAAFVKGVADTLRGFVRVVAF